MTATLTRHNQTAVRVTARQRIEAMAAEMWEYPHEQIMTLIKHRVPKFKLRFELEELIYESLEPTDADGFCAGYGWWVIDPTGGANSIPATDLPECMAFDAESTKEHNQRNEPSSQDNDYHPFLAVAYGLPADHDEPLYYLWVGPRDNSQRLIEMPGDRTLITFNGGVHDSKYLSCEYEGEPLPIIHVDVMALVTMYRGICDDKQQAAYRRYAANKRGGKSAPEWFAHATPASLDESAKNILGMPIVKGINPLDDEAPQNVIEYCAQDVAITVELLQRIYPILYKRFIPSNVTWVGMASSMGLAAYVGDGWAQHCEKFADYTTDRATAKAWLSYHSQQYAKLYINDGAAKVGINPVGDPVSRFPKSGVWCHKYSNTYPAFDASQEDGLLTHILIAFDHANFERAVTTDPTVEQWECGHSLLLGTRTPESIEFESAKRRTQLIKQFMTESVATDLLHCALTIANYEIMQQERDIRVCAFGMPEEGVVSISLMGESDDPDWPLKVSEKVEALCHQLCDEVLEDMGVAF